MIKSSFFSLFAPQKHHKDCQTRPAALHSLLLSLEPRMVFDASLVATAEATDVLQPVVQAEVFDAVQGDAELQSSTDAGQHGVPFGFAPFADPWSAPSEVTFSGSFTVTEDGTLAFGPGAVSLSDADSNNFIITLSVEHGTLSLEYVPGVVGNKYNFSEDNKSVSFEADLLTCQNVLDTLKYHPDADYNGTDTLSVSVNDFVNTNQKFTQEITVTSMPDKPDFVDADKLPSSMQANEDEQTDIKFNFGTVGSPDVRPLQITDVDGVDGSYSLTLSITDGKLLHSGSELGGATTVGNTTTYTLLGKTLSEINSILGTLEFIGSKDVYGTSTLTVSITDADVAHDPLVKSFSIEVLPVNDKPTLQPADITDEAHQLHVLEVQPNGDGGEGVFTLEHFNIHYDASNPAHQPDAHGNLPVKLFDVDNNLHQLVVNVSNAPTQGSLWRKIGADWVKLSAGSTFSLWDVYKGWVKYIHNPDQQVREEITAGSEQDSFTFEVSDGAGGVTSGVMYVSLEPVNQPPKVEVGTIPGVLERLDAVQLTDPVTGASYIQYTVWGYEGEQGIPFAFHVIDPDQAPGADYSVTLTRLPDPKHGAFWYSADGVTYTKLTVGTEISLQAIQQGYLRFNHSGIEGEYHFDFDVQVTDDGGGEGVGGSKSVTTTLKLNIRPNNDHPEWVPGLGGIWDDGEHAISVDGSRVVPITAATLNAHDTDSSAENITYTITGISGDSGRLLYLAGYNHEGKPIYREIRNGDKVSQTDVSAGKIFWWFNNTTGTQNADVTFIVRDGSISATPAPADKDQPLPTYPLTGSSQTGWEHGSGHHEGGIGTWVMTSPGSYEWVLTEHTLHITASNIPTGDTPVEIAVIDPIPHLLPLPGQVTVDEGKSVCLDNTILHAWFSNGSLPGDITGQPNAKPENLTFRVIGKPEHGWLALSDDGGVTLTYLGLYSSFTQDDIDAGRVFYQHSGYERFTDTFVFTVSDGRQQVGGGDGTQFTLTLDITPVNDTPERDAGSAVQVKEHDITNADASTPGGVATITLEHINVWDVDGTRDKPGETTYSQSNDLYIVITELPACGTLLYNGVPVTALAAANVNAVKAGAGWATWGTDPLMAGVTIISVADIASGKLVYQHNGKEIFYDNFSYLLSDNKGIVTGDPNHDGGSVNQFEQQVQVIVAPVNDIPEKVPGPVQPLELPEGGTLVIGNSNIAFHDPDGTPEAIQFILTQLPEHGKLYLNGVVLGIDSVFTQADIDAGLLKYVHDGSENHQDTFACKVSDSIYLSSGSEPFVFTIHQVNDAPTIDAPSTLYVESLAGGIIINGIKVTDPDYGPNNVYDPLTDSGVHTDIFTVIVELKNTVANPGIDLDKILVSFVHNTELAIAYNAVTHSYSFTGTFAQIKTALAAVRVETKVESGTAYDPDGDIFLHVKVYDGEPDGSGGWKTANGSGGTDVYSAEDTVRIYISPVNNPPAFETCPSGITAIEDGAAVAVNDGNFLEIKDSDAFSRGGNSITLEVSHGVLLVNSISGPVISGLGTSRLTIEGTRDQINSVLASLRYKPHAEYNGSDTIVFTYKDGANSGEIPPSITATAPSGHGSTFIYDTGKLNGDGTPLLGLALYGEIAVTVTPVNDAPVITAPTEVFIKEELLFSGTDEMGNPVDILLDDIDITHPGNSSSSFSHDSLTVTLTVDSGWLKFNAGDVDASLTTVFTNPVGGGHTQIVLTGSRDALNATLAKLRYDRTDWDATSPATLTLVVSDVYNVDQSNGSSDQHSSHSVSHNILINCSNNNDAPSINAPAAGWTVKEDAGATKIFTGSETITMSDPDTFGGQVCVIISVAYGELGVSKADLAASGFNFAGNPSLQDKFIVSADKKSIVFKASLDAINTALQHITYKPRANFNGTDTVTLYVNDLGLWGDTTGTEEAIPANALGITGQGLADTTQRSLTVTAVNDAPTSSASTVDFWNNSGATLGDFEDSELGVITGKSVGDLFSSLFRDAADNQKTGSNSSGSESNQFAGIVIVGNSVSAAQGVWQYSLDGNSWSALPSCSTTNGIFLDATAQLRFVPATDFNGKPGVLSVKLVDNSAAEPGNPALPTSGTTGLHVAGANSGGITRYSAANVTLTTFIRPVNDAPEVNGTHTTLGAVAEDTADPAGNTIGALFNSAFKDSKDTVSAAVSGGSVQNALAGIVIVANAAEAATGEWQYSLNGTQWFSVPATGSLGDSNGLFLAVTAKLRFVPAGDYNGAPGVLTVHLVDNSAADAVHNNPLLPANGARVDISGTLRGGTTRYSANTLELRTTIAAVNDAPTTTSGMNESVTLPSISEDTAGSGKTVSDLFSTLFSDSRDTITGGSSANSFAGVLVTHNAATATQGQWEYHDGSSWKHIPSVATGEGFALQATWSIRFTPASNWNGTPGGLTVRLIDSSSVVAGSNPAASFGSVTAINAVGGVTRYSAETITLSTSIVAVNDAPDIVTAESLQTCSHTEDTVTVTTITDLFAAAFTDQRDNVSGGSTANEFIGVIVTGSTVTSVQGVWEYNTGSGWQAFTSLSATNGLFLAKDTQVRFVPSAHYNGTVGELTARVVENGSQTFTTGDRVNVQTNSGGSTQISAAEVTLGGSVQAVNDAPVADNVTPVNLPAVNEDALVTGVQVSSLFGGRFSDATDDLQNISNPTGSVAHLFAGIVVSDVVQDATKGLWKYSADGGVNWVTISGGMFIQEGDLIAFHPATHWNGTPGDLQAHLVERSGVYSGVLPASGTITSLASTGGTTPYSVAAVTLQTSVTAVNDAPFWNEDVFSGITNANGDHFVYLGSIVPVDTLPSTDPANHFVTTVQDALIRHGHSGFLDTLDDVIGGSSANTLQGILITGVSGNSHLGDWQFEYAPGDWRPLVASESAALFLSATTNIRFVCDPTYVLPAGDFPHTALTVALVDSSTASFTSGNTYAASLADRGGSTAVSEQVIPLWLTVVPFNYLPDINGGAGIAGVTTLERQPVQLAPGVTVSDINLDHSQTFSQWNGASLSIHRTGGAHTDDVFSLSNPAFGSLVEGSSINVGGLIIGTVSRNSGGMLTLLFNSNATASLVGQFAEQIAYTNSSLNPPAQVTLRWTLDDGNYADNGVLLQGRNPAGMSSGLCLADQQVTIIAVNDAPSAVDDGMDVSSEDTSTHAGNVLLNDNDPEHDALTVIAHDHAVFGTLQMQADGSYTYRLNMSHPLVYLLAPGSTLTERISYTITDGEYTSTAWLTITITKPSSPISVEEEKKESDNKKPYVPPASLPHHTVDNGYGSGISVDKPVVRAVETVREVLSASVKATLATLEEKLRTLTPSERMVLYLANAPDDQILVTGASQTIRLPEGMFKHTGRNVSLSYIVTLADGSPLPHWLSYDARSQTFTALPDRPQDEPVVVKVIAKDQYNNTSSTFFQINVVRNDALVTPVDQDTQSDAERKAATEHNDESQNIHKDEASPQAEHVDRETTENTPHDIFVLPLSEKTRATGLDQQVAENGQNSLWAQAQKSIRQLFEGQLLQ